MQIQESGETGQTREAKLSVKLHFPGHLWRADSAILALMFKKSAKKGHLLVVVAIMAVAVVVSDGDGRLVCTCVSSFLSSGC